MIIKEYGKKAWRKVKKLHKRNQRLKQLKQRHKRELKKIEYNVARTEAEWKEAVGALYRDFSGREMNWEDPQRFTEKIVWRKMYDAHPVYGKLSDKYAVREWVARKIGEEYLIPLLGVWDRAEDIDFDSLPDQFVLKTNNASATNIIVKDKAKLNKKEAVENLRYWLKYPFWAISGELHYKPIPPKVIAEKFMLPPDMNDLPDYKFYCFAGKVFAVLIIRQVLFDRTKGKSLWVDRSGNVLPMDIGHFERFEGETALPSCFSQMVEIAETLAGGFAHVRVDLYNVKGQIYFGEMTFTSGSGQYKFDPDEWDYKFGSLWDTSKPQVDEKAVDA